MNEMIANPVYWAIYGLMVAIFSANIWKEIVECREKIRVHDSELENEYITQDEYDKRVKECLFGRNFVVGCLVATMVAVPVCALFDINFLVVLLAIGLLLRVGAFCLGPFINPSPYRWKTSVWRGLHRNWRRFR